MSSASRPYHSVARAAATEEARKRILHCFWQMLGERSAEEITLDDVAARAGSTRQTLIRYFGSKDGMLQAMADSIGIDVRARRQRAAHATLDEHIAALVRDYEEVGDVIVQLLAQEARLSSLRHFLDLGRAGHRGWIAQVFAQWLDPLAPEPRALLTDQLYAVTDINVWKLLQRDFGHSAETTSALIADMARRMVAAPPR